MANEQILIGYGKIWYAPVGEANPDETSIGYGDDWGGNWLYLGNTLEPLTLAIESNIVSVKIQQSTAPAKQSKVSEIMTLKTTMAEHDMTLLNILLGGTLSSTAAGASQVGYSELPFGGESDVDQYKWGFETLYKDSSNNQLPVRYFFHVGSIALDGDIPFDAENPAGIPVAITILADTSQTVGAQIGTIQMVTAPATS